MRRDQDDFQDRVAELATKGRVRKRRGTSVLYEKRADGLLIPVTTADGVSVFPWKTLFASLAIMLAVKTGLYVVMGEQAVLQMAHSLAEDHTAAKAAVVLLQPEPLSGWLVSQTEDALTALDLSI